MYPVSKEAQGKELNFIKNTLQNSNYNINKIKNIHHKNEIHTSTHNAEKQNGTFSHTAEKKQEESQNYSWTHK
jgi:hypothetical protein